MKGQGFRLNGETIPVVPWFPVGFIIEMNREDNPSQFFGGTWELYGVGCVTACINKNDTDTNTRTSFNQTLGTEIGSKYLHKHYHTSPVFMYDTTVSNPTPVMNYHSTGKQGDIATTQAGSGDAQNIQPTKLVYRWVKTAY